MIRKDNGLMPQFLTQWSLFQGQGKGWWQESFGPFVEDVPVEGVCTDGDYQDYKREAEVSLNAHTLHSDSKAPSS